MRPRRATVVFCLVMGALLAYALNHLVGLVFEAGRQGSSIFQEGAVARSFVEHPLPYTGTPAVIAAVIGALAALGALASLGEKDMHSAGKGREHGTAKVGSARDTARFADSKDPRNNVLFAKGVGMRLEGEAADRRYEKNKNVLVQGGPGSGKTFNYVVPNLLQANSSYVLTDPKGSTVKMMGTFLLREGYKVRVFNTVDFQESLHYNPFAYISSQLDVLKLVTLIIDNTNGDEARRGDAFWEKAERLLLIALIAYIWEAGDASEQNISTLIDLIGAAEVRDNDPAFESTLDIMFRRWADRNPESFAVRQYGLFKQGAADTLRSILVSVAVRMQPFDLDMIREVMAFDELKLDRIGDEKTFLGLVMSDTDTTFGFLIAMIEYQLINLLVEKADALPAHRLEVPVQIYFDEFRNIGRVPMWETMISTIRSRGISATMLVQSLAQLTGLYKDEADTLIDCCDTFITFGGGRSKTTAGAISEYIGQETVSTYSRSESRGQSGSVSFSEQAVARSAMFADEVGRLPTGQCIVLITGEQAVRARNYETERHPNFKYTAYARGSGLYYAGDESRNEFDHFFDGVEKESIEMYEFTA